MSNISNKEMEAAKALISLKKDNKNLIKRYKELDNNVDKLLDYTSAITGSKALMNGPVFSFDIQKIMNWIVDGAERDITNLQLYHIEEALDILQKNKITSLGTDAAEAITETYYVISKWLNREITTRKANIKLRELSERIEKNRGLLTSIPRDLMRYYKSAIGLSAVSSTVVYINFKNFIAALSALRLAVKSSSFGTVALSSIVGLSNDLLSDMNELTIRDYLKFFFISRPNTDIIMKQFTDFTDLEIPMESNFFYKGLQTITGGMFSPSIEREKRNIIFDIETITAEIDNLFYSRDSFYLFISILTATLVFMLLIIVYTKTQKAKVFEKKKLISNIDSGKHKLKRKSKVRKRSVRRSTSKKKRSIKNKKRSVRRSTSKKKRSIKKKKRSVRRSIKKKK